MARTRSQAAKAAAEADGVTSDGPFQPWSMSPTAVAAYFGTDLKKGLTAQQVDGKLERYGHNELLKPPGKPLWKLVLEQFDDMLVKILLLAAGVSFLLAYLEGDGEEGLRAYIEPLVILLILVLNAVVGVWQESNAEAALEALKELQTETARVVREGRVVSDLPAREVVPGDVVELHMGDKVPADIRVVSLKTAILRAEQASLTGEAVPVQKIPDAVFEGDIELQGKENMLFAGTAIAYGSCYGIVTSTGMSTELGGIHAQIQEASEEEEDTPLKQKLNEFGETLAQVIFWICVTVWLINYKHFVTWESQPNGWPDLSTVSFSLSKCTYYFKIAVALAVAAIPEGLPAVITTCLALGTRQMAKKNAIVRKLPSVETLGCTNVICSDKTGTLTTNQMSAVCLVAPGSSVADLRTFDVVGHTFNPDEGEIVGLPTTLDATLTSVAEVCAVCNEASIELRGGRYKAVGNPTEAALLVLAEKLGVPDRQLTARIAAQRKAAAAAAIQEELANGGADDLLKTPLVTGQASYVMKGAGAGLAPEGACAYYKQQLPKWDILEFDRERKSMSVLCRREDGSGRGANVLLVKGAAECVLQRCSKVRLANGTVKPLDAGARKVLESAIEGMAGRALRCLALAEKSELGELSKYDGNTSHPAHKLLMDPSQYADIESDLILVGLAGLEDPPRPEVPGAIAECQRAGIRVVVITGDNKLTAEAICRKVGVFAPGETLEGRSMTGRQFMDLSEADRAAVLYGTGGRCFSRAEPRHKVEIVRLLKDMGEVAAMTGDGVNDAPALKLADIGVAMGITGTEVAKEASDMVLADDNFSTIVAAIEAGRAIFNNMKAFIRYMISSNIGEVFSIFFTAALGLPEGLIPVQLLWVNLVTDGPPATALGFNPPDLDIMEKPPRRKDESLVSPWIFIRWLVVGLYVGAATVGVFCAWYLMDSVPFLGIDLSADGHTTVSWTQLRAWESCEAGAEDGLWAGFNPKPYGVQGGDHVSWGSNPCDYFRDGKAKASTLSLTTLVLIEMFNALNALSEDNSLLQMPPHQNPWLLVAMAVSVGLHLLIMYVPVLAGIFSIVPLTLQEWALVVAFASPVMLIDEVLKWVGRNIVNRKHPAVKAKAD